MYILGISSFYHDSAAVLTQNGKIIAAFEEERFTRRKHDNNFPKNAILACLKSANITINMVDKIAYYEKPLLKFERLIEIFIDTYPRSLNVFVKAIPQWLSEKIKVEHIIRKELKYSGKIYFLPHHTSHAASAFLSSPFKKAAVLTVDGVGEYQTTCMWLGNNHKLKLLGEINFPDSLGLLYSTFTSFLGFKVNEDEYKVMGMAAYGKPLYVNKFYKIIDVKSDGSYRLNLKYFSFRESDKMWNSSFEKIFGNARKPASRITQKHKDIAASIQFITEDIYFKMINHLQILTRQKNLCVAGGVALNALANGKIFKNTSFKKAYIIGAAGDSGAALGASIYIANAGYRKTKTITNLLLGNSYDMKQIEKIVSKSNLRFEYYNNKELVKKAADFLHRGKIIGWFQGRMEFGPRALGARSILAAPFPYSMKGKVNNIKKREQFRPFAGSVLEDKAGDFFEVPQSQKSFPFMNFCFQVKKSAIDKIPAITHKDGSCRIQTIVKSDGIYFELLREFYKITKIPVILNTSFNLGGEPLVESPEQAIDDFLKTEMNYLVLGNYIISK